METRHILYISSPGMPTPVKDYGGLEWVAQMCAEEMRNRGHEVTMVCSADSDEKWYKERGIERIPTVFSAILALRRLEKHAYEVYKARISDFKKFDIIHDHTHVQHSVFLQQKVPELKVIRTIHDDCPFGQPPPLKFPNFVGVSYTHSSRLSWSMHGVCTRTVQHGIPLDLYPFQEEKGDRLLTLGRIQPLKGIHIAVDVCKARDIPLDVVGDDTHIPNDPYVERIKSMCDGELIKYHGKVDHETKVKFFQNAKACIFFSTFEEPFGLMALESLSCGTPIITSGRGGLGETTVDGYNGYLCERPFDVAKAAAQVMNGEISSDDCRKSVDPYFTVGRMMDDYEKLYLEILNGGGW